MLVYPSAGTLFKLTVANASPPISTLCRFTVVDTYGPEGGVAVMVGGTDVELGTTVGVAVGCVSNTFKSGLYKPSV